MQQIRLGVVNFLNTVPLIDGLEMMDGISLLPMVPSSLIGCLEDGVVDLALASSIDYQKSSLDLRILRVGLLSSDGHTLTVRLCSRKPIETVQEVHCDIDSHTSIALLQIVMKDVYDTEIIIVPTEIRHLSEDKNDWPDSMLMIGDKVVSSTNEIEFPYELDLGEAWKQQTGLPFVFAVWMGRVDLAQAIVDDIAMSLERQLRKNMQRLEQVVSTSAIKRGWDKQKALEYVGETMQYIWTDRHESSLALFYKRANEIGIISSPFEVQFFDWK